MEHLKNMFVPLASNAKEVQQLDTQNDIKQVTPYRQYNNVTNQVFTSKYTWLTFLPLNLIQQFSKPPNIYFLLIGILQMIPIISPTQGVPTMYIPLGIIIFITGLKDLYEDRERSISDRIENNRQYQKIQQSGDNSKILSKQIKSGMIIKVKKNDILPCDGLLLYVIQNKKYAFVSTSNLDGQMHLKRKCLHHQLLKWNSNKNQNFFKDFHVNCDKPNSDYHKFQGNITIETQNYSLDQSNVCFRGTKLRNTEYILILVLFTGRQTKVLLNMSDPHAKRANLQKRLKTLILVIFFSIIILSFFFAFMFEQTSKKMQFGFMRSSFKRFIIGFFSWILNLTNLIPISLLVTLESVNLISGKIISNDKDMITNQFKPMVNTSNIIQDLGCIDYVASDKTGTLTKNQLKVKKISDSSGKYNHTDDIPFDILEMFSICHNGHVSEGEFESASQDQVAILQFCREKGITLLDRTQYSMQLKKQQKCQCISIIHNIQFTSERKRQSLIIDKQGKYFILTKGSDDSINKISSTKNTYKQKIMQDVISFAKQGLRTMVLAIRQLERNIIEEWTEKLIEAKNKNCKQSIRKLQQQIEQNLRVIGAIGISDELQDDVIEVVETIINAGIQFMIISGDRAETVMSIASNLKTDQSPFLCPINEYRPEYTNQKFLVFARCTPKDKKKIVTAIHGNVLAIGDGANDVSMLTSSTFGIGIAGKQGRAAAQSSDIAISQFKHLKKLLFYYGRQTYRKNSYLISYNFYKNILFTTPQIIFGFLSFYSGVSIYQRYLAQFYNTIFTSAAIFLYAILDKSQKQLDLINNKNNLYKYSKSQSYFSLKTIAFYLIQAVMIGVVSSLLCFNLYSDLYPSPHDLKLNEISSIIMFYVVIYVNLIVVSVQKYQSATVLLISIAGIISYVLFFQLMLQLGTMQSLSIKIFFNIPTLILISLMLLASAIISYIFKLIEKLTNITKKQQYKIQHKQQSIMMITYNDLVVDTNQSN